MKILTTLFYVFGFGCFFIIALDIDTRHQTAYYVLMIPFMIVLMFMILLKIYIIWR